jgi:dUTPase
MVISKYERVEWELSQSIDKTKRGTKGFGSTGSK